MTERELSWDPFDEQTSDATCAHIINVPQVMHDNVLGNTGTGVFFCVRDALYFGGVAFHFETTE